MGRKTHPKVGCGGVFENQRVRIGIIENAAI
jgi:hypothetical protein